MGTIRNRVFRKIPGQFAKCPGQFAKCPGKLANCPGILRNALFRIVPITYTLR